MHIDQYVVLFYGLFSLGRALLWVARLSDGSGSMLLLLATVLALSFSFDWGNAQAVLAPMAAFLPAIIAGVVGACCRE
jgi:hypothetical protein